MRKFCVVLLFILAGFAGFSQSNFGPNFGPFRPDTTNAFPRFIDRIYYGGNAGLWFGNPTYINLSPMVGVKVSRNFSLGGTFTYNYYQQKYAGVKYSNYIYGMGPFVRYRVMENLFLQAQWDHLSVLNPNSILPNDRAWVDNLLVGGGYRQPFNDYGSFIIMGFWNLNQTPLSPYPNPIIQMGFNMRF